MYCINCGNQLKSFDKFCTSCGNPTTREQSKSLKNNYDDKWWYRLAKVGYVAAYLPLLLSVIVVWDENSPSYSYYGGQRGSYSEAFWYSVLTLVIGVVFMRLVKISFLYIAFGEKPEWKKELKKYS